MNDDLISRQAAIDAYILHTMDYLEGKKPKRAFTEVLRELPSAQSKRENVRGEWIHDEITRNGNTVYTPNAKCSICYCYVFQESNFCPNCGADMRSKS